MGTPNGQLPNWQPQNDHPPGEDPIEEQVFNLLAEKFGVLQKKALMGAEAYAREEVVYEPPPDPAEELEELRRRAKRLKEKGSDEDRVNFLFEMKWVSYPKACELLALLEKLHRRSGSNRPRSLLLLARSANGKTEIGKRFQARHPPALTLDEEYIHYPVVSIVMPPQPTVGRFFAKILAQYGVNTNASGRNADKASRAEGLMRDTGVTTLIIDEVHQVRDATTEKQKTQVLNAIKNLSTEMSIHVVGLGMKSAEFDFSRDGQLASRFMVEGLPKWSMKPREEKIEDGEEEHGCKEEYLSLLQSLEELLPLRRPSNLVKTSLATKILDMGDRRLGDIVETISFAAEEAIESGEERITTEVLDDCDWHKSAKRRKKVRREV